jgi:hypothetical protein
MVLVELFSSEHFHQLGAPRTQFRYFFPLDASHVIAPAPPSSTRRRVLPPRPTTLGTDLVGSPRHLGRLRIDGIATVAPGEVAAFESKPDIPDPEEERHTGARGLVGSGAVSDDVEVEQLPEAVGDLFGRDAHGAFDGPVDPIPATRLHDIQGDGLT